MGTAVEKAEEKTFNLVSGFEGMSEADREEYQDELDDIGGSGISAYKIKLPSGGALQFEIETDTEGDPDYQKEIEAVIVFTHRMNATFPKDEEGKPVLNQPPICSAVDGKTGTNFQTGKIIQCEGCPYNQFGSDGRGKRCKNMRRLYLLMSGKQMPYLLTLPPTSVGDIEKALKKIMAGSKFSYTRMVMKFKLQKIDKNGNIYSKVTMEKAGILSDEQYETVKKLRESLKREFTNVAVSLDDYEAPEDGARTEAPQQTARSDDGFMNIPEGVEDSALPFN